VIYFENNGEPEVYLSSADWMNRNLSQRIELAFPIYNPEFRDRIVHESLDLYIKDNAGSFELHESGEYLRPKATAERKSAQENLLAELVLERKES
jgi:polyphosphate kinase